MTNSTFDDFWSGDRTCSIDGCDKPYIARGWCHMHYRRWHKHGDPLLVFPKGYRGPPITRFMKYVQKTAGCWIWTGTKDDSGYGRFAWGKRDLGAECRSAAAHIFSYLHFKGEYDRALVIDHICNNRACVNPGHLRPLSSSMNLLRGHLLRAIADGATREELLGLVEEALDG